MESDRILYRKRTKELIDHLQDQSEEDQMKFFGLTDPSLLEWHLGKAIDGTTESRFGYEVWDLVSKKSGEVMGTCGYHYWNKDHDRAEIGYHLWDEFKRQGLMTEALVTILKYGFNQMNLNRIEGLTATYNDASKATLKKMGFKEEGCLREHYLINGNYEDSVIYSLLKKEFTIE